MFIVLSLFVRTRPPQVCTGPEQLVCSQVVDDHGFSLSTDRVLNLEELKAYMRTVAKFLRVQELAGIERALEQRDRESQESLDRPLGRMQVKLCCGPITRVLSKGQRSGPLQQRDRDPKEYMYRPLSRMQVMRWSPGGLGSGLHRSKFMAQWGGPEAAGQGVPGGSGMVFGQDAGGSWRGCMECREQDEGPWSRGIKSLRIPWAGGGALHSTGMASHPG